MFCCQCGERDEFPVYIVLGVLLNPPDQYVHWFRDGRGQYYISRCRTCEYWLAREAADEAWREAVARANARWYARAWNISAPYWVADQWYDRQ